MEISSPFPKWFPGIRLRFPRLAVNSHVTTLLALFILYCKVGFLAEPTAHRFKKTDWQ